MRGCNGLMLKIDQKRWLNWAGRLIVVVACIFLARKGWLYREWFSGWRPGGGTLIYMGLGMAGYACASGLLAVAWFALVRYWDPAADFNHVFRLYARTQIAKYIPGNVFHLTGRWLGARQINVSHKTILGATGYELAGMAAIAAIMAAYGALVKDSSTKVCFQLAAGLMVLAAIFPFVVVKCSVWIPRLPAVGWPIQTRVTGISGYIPAHFLYMFYFMIVGSLFAGWIYRVTGVFDANLTMFIISTFALAWLAGFIVPGASGGLGVREAILVGMLGGMVGEAQSVIIAFGFRLVTIGGDVLFFAFSFLISSRSGRYRLS